jgi:hypothetical protein
VLPNLPDEEERAAAVAVDDVGGLTLLVSSGTNIQHVNGALPACFVCLPRPSMAEHSSASAAAISGTSLPQRCGSLAFRSAVDDRATSNPESGTSVSSSAADSLLLGSSPAPEEGAECAIGRAPSSHQVGAAGAFRPPAVGARGDDGAEPAGTLAPLNLAGDTRRSSTETEGMGSGLSMSTRENCRSEKGSTATSLTPSSSGRCGRCHRKVSSHDASQVESLTMVARGVAGDSEVRSLVLTPKQEVEWWMARICALVVAAFVPTRHSPAMARNIQFLVLASPPHWNHLHGPELGSSSACAQAQPFGFLGITYGP